jgi:hypothetical protein
VREGRKYKGKGIARQRMSFCGKKPGLEKPQVFFDWQVLLYVLELEYVWYGMIKPCPKAALTKISASLLSSAHLFMTKRFLSCLYVVNKTEFNSCAYKGMNLSVVENLRYFNR